MLTEKLKLLCSQPGVSGDEAAVRETIYRLASPYASQLRVDRMGNLLVFAKGRRVPARKLMLASHMDQVGLMVTRITEDGYLKFAFVGDVDARYATGKRVLVGSAQLPGVVGLKPIHLTEPEERKQLPEAKQLYVDIGCRSRAEAEKLVSPGDTACFAAQAREFGSGYFRAGALGDRLGCAVLLELLEQGLPVDAWLAFTVQEQVGCRGAATAAYGIEPEEALVLSAMPSGDLPGSDGDRGFALGKGVCVPMREQKALYDQRLLRELREAAGRQEIPIQIKSGEFSTGAASVQTCAGGIPVAAIGAAVRYGNTSVCTGCIEDFEQLLRLCRAWMEEA